MEGEYGRGIPVWLDSAEMVECERAAKNRWQYARSSGIGNQRKDQSRSDNDVDWVGIRSEVAVAKLFGLGYERIFRVGTDDGSDLNFKGVSIDVKGTFHANGKLILRRELRADVAILVTATQSSDVMRVVGYSTASHYKAHMEPFLMSGNWVDGVRQENLMPVEGVWAMGVSAEMRRAKLSAPLHVRDQPRAAAHSHGSAASSSARPASQGAGASGYLPVPDFP